MVIEPARFNRIHMNHLSPVYKFYHHQLKDAFSNIEAIEKTKEFCQTYTHTNLEDQLAMIEFFYANDYFDDVRACLQNEDLHPDVGTLYQIVLDRKTVPLTEKDKKELETLHFEHPSLRCLQLYLLVYAHYDMKKYAGMDKYSNDIQEVMYKINEPLFYYYMKLRFDELTFQHYWKTNRIVLAHKFAFKHIQSELSPAKQVSMHHHLGLSCTFQDYETAISYIHKALKMAEEHKFNRAVHALKNNTIPFISAFHRKNLEVFTSDVIEQAHLAIALGNNNRGVEILTSLGSLTPFQESYLGLARKDLSLLRHAKKRFTEEYSDLFFAQLPDYYMKRVLTIM